VYCSNGADKKKRIMSIHETFSIMEKPIRLEAGFIRPKKNGGWDSPFDPREVTILQRVTPGNILFLQDIPGMIEAYGVKISLRLN
jgi:hypothetical protein